MSLLFVLISATPLVRTADLYGMARAIEVGAKNCADAWQLAPPAVDVCADATSLPDGCCPVVFVDDNSDPGALAVHFVSDRFQPAARVYMNNASGVNTGDWSASEGASHEVLEALCDPLCDAWHTHPTRPGIEVALEVSDPVQGFYFVEAAGQRWRVSNFVLPAWFEHHPDGGFFDWMSELHEAGEVGANGYVILRDKTGATWTEDAFGARSMAAKKPGAAHPWARSSRRLAVNP
jgi:hypothetical protein